MDEWIDRFEAAPNSYSPQRGILLGVEESMEIGRLRAEVVLR